MVKRQVGKIVFVGSVQGKFAIPYRSAYAASKHALQAFADTLRAEVHKDNVKVLIVSPGYINTALSMNALTSSGTSYGGRFYFNFSIERFLYCLFLFLLNSY